MYEETISNRQQVGKVSPIIHIPWIKSKHFRTLSNKRSARSSTVKLISLLFIEEECPSVEGILIIEIFRQHLIFET